MLAARRPVRRFLHQLQPGNRCTSRDKKKPGRSQGLGFSSLVCCFAHMIAREAITIADLVILEGVALQGLTRNRLYPSLAVMGYLEAQQGAEARTAFRTAEKLYKRYKNDTTSRRNLKKRGKIPPVDLSRVLDFKKIGESLSTGDAPLNGVSRMEGRYDWPIYTMSDRPGFFFIPGALDVQQQAYWIKECVTSFPQPPNRTNHDALHGPLEELWSAAQSNRVLAERSKEGEASQAQGRDDPCGTSEESEESSNGSKWQFLSKAELRDANGLKVIPATTLLRKLRWATVGLQFDWSKKKYNPSLPHRPIPAELASLAAQLARPAAGEAGFHAEAAIINYYGPDDMLGGHIDDMEADLSKPIVSISLGCKAIFLLGGETRDDAPIAMFLRSGDAVLMAGPTRRCFHGIPRTFVAPEESELPDFQTSLQTCMTDALLEYIAETRINMNIRQVY